MWSAWATEHLMDGAARMWRASAIIRHTTAAGLRLVTGCGALATRAHHEPSPLIECGRRVLWSTLHRLPWIVVSEALKRQTLSADHVHVTVVFDAVVFLQNLLWVLDLTVIELKLQRDLRKAHCAPPPDDPLFRTVVHVAAPVLTDALAAVLPGPPAAMMRGVALGCQIHDTAFETRGVGINNRADAWMRDGVAYVLVGVALDVGVRHTVPEFVAPAAVCLACVALTAAAACQPLGEPMAIAERPTPFAARIIAAPYLLAHQVIERLRRALLAGVFAPSLNQRVPPATALLRIYRALQTPAVQWVLPTELVRPELHYLVAELITPETLGEVLKHIGLVLDVSSNPIKRNAVVGLGARTLGKITGLPEPVVDMLQQVLVDPENIDTLRHAQRSLASRMSEAHVDRPLTFEQWAKLGVDAKDVMRWNLDAALSGTTWVKMVPPEQSTAVHEVWVDDLDASAWLEVRRTAAAGGNRSERDC